MEPSEPTETPAMKTRTMEWTCPKCRSRNAQPIPEATPDGKLVAVKCACCGADYYATAVIRTPAGRPPAVYGVTWV